MRLFLAAYPSAQDAEALASLLPLPGPGLRPLPPAQIHLTLAFLGNTDPERLPALFHTLDHQLTPPSAFRLALESLITLPPRGRPRLVALLAEAPLPLVDLRNRLVKAILETLTQGHDESFEGSAPAPFLPHLTLARLSRTAPPPPRRQPLPTRAPHELELREIRLVKSELHPAGAVHTAIHRTGLPRRDEAGPIDSEIPRNPG